MRAYPKREAWDIVCEKKANQAYLDPAFVELLFIMLEVFRLSSLRSSKLDSKSAGIESGKYIHNGVLRKPPVGDIWAIRSALLRIGIIATAQIRCLSWTFDLSCLS